MQRLFDRDPFTRIQRVFVGADDGRSFQLVTQQDVEGIVEDAKYNYNITSHKRVKKFGNDFATLAAQIPLTLYWDLVRKGIADDDAAMKKWMNDPDNKFFRLQNGTV
jgi:hypothetical protein